MHAGWSRRARTADFLDVGEGSYQLSYGPMTAARVMPCRGGGARSVTRSSEPSDRRENAARAEGFEPSTDPVLETGALAAELRACGRRDRNRTDGLLRFRQALYAC